MAHLSTLTALAAHPYGWHGWFFPFFPFFGFLLFWLVAAFVIRGVFWRRWRGGGGYGPWGGPGYGGGAAQVLAERFARGEIDEQEYRARLEVLRAGRS